MHLRRTEVVFYLDSPVSRIGFGVLDINVHFAHIILDLLITELGGINIADAGADVILAGFAGLNGKIIFLCTLENK